LQAQGQFAKYGSIHLKENAKVPSIVEFKVGCCGQRHLRAYRFKNHP
jgi:hypothetical protein